MKCEVIRATSPQFQGASQDILDIYNNYLTNGETLGVTFPEDMAVIRPVGIKGGIVVNMTHTHKQVAMIYFAGFEEADRRKGYLKACIKAANKWLKKYNSKIYAVQLNLFDNEEVWTNLGFTHRGMVNLVSCLFNCDPDTLFPVDIQRDSVSLDDLLAINPELGKHLFGDN